LQRGAGHFGQLGISTNYPHKDHGTISPSNSNDPITFTSSPCIIERLLPHSNDSPVVSVAAGDWHALALTKSGKVWAWGCNRNLQCGRKVKNGSSGNNSPSGTPSPAPTVTIPLPVPLAPTSVNGISPISFHATQISAGRSHSMIIAKETFRIPVDQNEVSLNPTTKIVAKNVVYCWGNSHQGQCGNYVTRRSVQGVLPAAVESLRDVDVRQISASGNHSMALTAQGRILCWGSHLDGQLGIGIAPASAAAYRTATDEESATSTNQSIHLASTSAIQCKPRLVSDLDFVAIAAGQEWNKLQQSSDSLSSSQNSISNPSLLSSIPRITSVQAGATYSTALDSLGQLYVWGSNDAGQLGVSIPKVNSLPYVHEDNNALRVVIDANHLQDCATNPLLHSRPLHVQSFDSRHIVVLPVRVDIIGDTRVTQIGCGPNHMWCVGSPRSPLDMENLLKVREYSKTLYEVQLEHHKPLSSLWPSSAEKDSLLNERINPTIPSSCRVSSDSPLINEKTKTVPATVDITRKQAALNMNGSLAQSSIRNVEVQTSILPDKIYYLHGKPQATGSSRSSRDNSEHVPRHSNESCVSYLPPMPNDSNPTINPIRVEPSFTATDVEDVTETEANDNYNVDNEETMLSQSATSVATTTSTDIVIKQSEISHAILDTDKEVPLRLSIGRKPSSTSMELQESHTKNSPNTLIKRISQKFMKRRKPPSAKSMMDEEMGASRSASPQDLKLGLNVEDSENHESDLFFANGVVDNSIGSSKTPRKARKSDRFFGNRRKKENS
jgi:alpha-tubulin suppressor-like RCC1 family protein